MSCSRSNARAPAQSIYDPFVLVAVSCELADTHRPSTTRSLLERNAKNVTVITATQYTGEEFFHDYLLAANLINAWSNGQATVSFI